MRRIVVVGTAGSGKSTVARAISDRLGVAHIELDAIFWQPGWTTLDQDEFLARVDALTAGDGWVADGNYGSDVQRITWRRADTLVWLDLPRHVVMWQVICRTVARTVTREELWNGNRERPLRDQLGSDPARSIVRYAWRTYESNREHFRAATSDPAHAHLRVIRVQNRRQVKRFLTVVG